MCFGENRGYPKLYLMAKRSLVGTRRRLARIGVTASLVRADGNEKGDAMADIRSEIRN